jgi:aquaporin Z
MRAGIPGDVEGLISRGVRDRRVDVRRSPTRNHAKSPSTVSWLTAETVGTFILTLVSAGADVIDAASGGGIGHVGRYLAPGFVLVALIFSLGGVSGAHINPAVTLAFVVRGVFPIRRAFAYWGCQLAGGSLAGLALVAVFGSLAHHGVSHMTLALSPITGAAAEAMLTAILVLIILGTSEEKAIVGKNAALAVGFTVTALGLFASPLSGASMNPARSLGPAIATLTFTDWWLYVVGPIAGALIATGIVQVLYGPPSYDEQKAAYGKRQ